MPNKSFGLLQEKILECLDASISSNADESGWGLTKGDGLAIVNTVEALLAYQELDALTSQSIQTTKEFIINFLKKSLSAELSKQNAKTRYLSYGVLGLNILGNNEFEDDCIERLRSSAKEKGGWSVVENEGDSELLPTYHAILALQKIGISVEDKHYDWLLSLQRSDYLLPFHSADINTSFGPSAVALYLFVNSSYKDKAVVEKLANELKQQLPSIFTQMLQPNENWVSRDSKTTFKLYGYGHALSALNLLHTNLYTLNLNKFLQAVSVTFEEGNNVNPVFSLCPENTWVPAFFELALALKSIRLNFDPIENLNSQQHERNLEISSEIESEKVRIAYESETIRIRQKILDEWEKEVIRQRRLSYDLSGVKNMITEAVVSELKTLLTEIKLRLFYYLLIVLGALSILGYFVIRLVVNREMSFTIVDGLATFAALILAIVGIILSLKKPKIEISNSSGQKT